MINDKRSPLHAQVEEAVSRIHVAIYLLRCLSEYPPSAAAGDYAQQVVEEVLLDVAKTLQASVDDIHKHAEAAFRREIKQRESAETGGAR